MPWFWSLIFPGQPSKDTIQKEGKQVTNDQSRTKQLTVSSVHASPRTREMSVAGGAQTASHITTWRPRHGERHAEVLPEFFFACCETPRPSSNNGGGITSYCGQKRGTNPEAS